MRVLALAATSVILLLALPATLADTARECNPANAFPSSAGWIMPPGRVLTYAVPAEQFGSVISASPLDVALYAGVACELDLNCHHHRVVGFTACGTHEQAVMEIVNPGPDTALVLLAIGQCGFGIAC